MGEYVCPALGGVLHVVRVSGWRRRMATLVGVVIPILWLFVPEVYPAELTQGWQVPVLLVCVWASLFGALFLFSMGWAGETYTLKDPRAPHERARHRQSQQAHELVHSRYGGR